MSAGSQNGHAPQTHLDEEWIRKYQSKSLALGELESAGRHLRDCGTCRRVLLARMGPVRLPEDLAEMPEPLHLSYEEITGYLDGDLSREAREKVEAHTFICASCSREIEDLRKLDAQLAAPVAVAQAVAPKLSIVERIAQFFQMPGRAREFGLAFGAIVAGIFLLLPSSPGSSGGSHAARLMDLAASSHGRLHLGGYALVIEGVIYLAYGLWRRR